MIIRFSKSFTLPIETVFGHFASPNGWVRLYGFGGQARVLDEGWYEVPLRRCPFPLIAQVTKREENALVCWMYRGFWKGEGAVYFSHGDGRTFVNGTETLSCRWLGAASRAVEWLVIDRTFAKTWELGWRRLQRPEALGDSASAGAER